MLLDVVQNDGSSIDAEVFTYDEASQSLQVSSSDIDKVGLYDLKLLVQFDGIGYE